MANPRKYRRFDQVRWRGRAAIVLRESNDMRHGIPYTRIGCIKDNFDDGYFDVPSEQLTFVRSGADVKKLLGVKGSQLAGLTC